MCLICVDLQRDKLTAKEARRNLGESYITLEDEHRLEVLKLIWEKEDQETDHDPLKGYFKNFIDYGSD